MNEYRVFGPPGTGKTTWLAKQVGLACHKYEHNQIAVTSFTKAAAVEVASLDLPISRENIGTLHSFGRRAAQIETDRIAEKGVNIKAWNDYNASMKGLQIAGTNNDPDDPYGGVTDVADGASLLSECSRLRQMLVPTESWPMNYQSFHKRWTAWKDNNNLFDFTDMLEYPYNEKISLPSHIRVLFVDEAQDLTPLQFGLIRQWSDGLDRIVICGDDDQAIYGWTGARAESMIDPEVPDDHVITLSQSHRVPRAVHALASRIIQKVKKRQPKEYQPRDYDGLVTSEKIGNWNYKNVKPDKLLENHIETGESVMILAPATYMLFPIIESLRACGIPFHNPYRRTQGAWNPLAMRGKKSTVARYLAYIANEIIPERSAESDGKYGWTYAELGMWIEMIPATLFRKKGSKAGIIRDCEQMDDRLISFQDAGLFLNDSLSTITANTDTTHLGTAVEDKYSGIIQLCQSIHLVQGYSALTEKPNIVVGTIHSVKGGQADHVYVIPDLPSAAIMSIEKSGIDEMVRLFYVAFTRAYKTLTILTPLNPQKSINKYLGNLTN